MRAAVLLLALLAAQWPGPAVALGPAPPPSAGAVLPLPVAAVLTGDGQTSVVVDLGAGPRPGRRTVAVTRAGTPQKARIVPVMSDDLAVALVVDTSAAGAATLPAWLSAGARFVLEAPATTRAVVIADTAPASAVTGPQLGPTEIVRALGSLRAGGDRDTAAALTLATRQFPAAAPGRRVVVLYTTAADAGATDAATLVSRFRAGGTILVVVGSVDAGRYWTNVATATGGFFAPAGNPVVVPALDQVQTTLSARYLVQFPTPSPLPAVLSVRVDTGVLTLAGVVTVSAAPPPVVAVPPRRAEPRITPAWGPLGAGLAALAAVALLLLLLRRRRAARRHRGGPPGGPVPDRPTPPVPGPPPAPDRMRPIARGRVAMPRPGPARGRAAVPRTDRARAPESPDPDPADPE